MADNQTVIIGKRLKEYFNTQNITQQQVADKLGIKQAGVSKLLNGKPFGKKTAKKWEEIFGINPNWLLTGDGNMLIIDSHNKFKEKEEEYIKAAKMTEDEKFSVLMTLIEQHGDLIRQNGQLIEQNKMLIQHTMDLSETNSKQTSLLESIMKSQPSQNADGNLNT